MYGNGESRTGRSAPGERASRELANWRLLLARDLLARNPGLAIDSLNAALAAILDALVFMRLAELRGFPCPHSVAELLAGDRLYERLRQLFRDAQDCLGAPLFDVAAPAAIPPGLQVSDDMLRQIVGRLHQGRLGDWLRQLAPADLGPLYEGLMCRQVCLDESGTPLAELKPELRRTGGVYYTPETIVAEIVEHTLGQRLARLTDEAAAHPVLLRAARLRLVDPACGSGAFLLAAWDCLRRWHRQHYLRDPERWSQGPRPRLCRDTNGEWRLTLGERVRLLGHVYGVDVDPHAVVVCRFSLLLAVCDGLPPEELARIRSSGVRNALVEALQTHVRCGDSLIDTRHALLPDAGLRPFDWHHPEQGFGRILARGGFDVVIGNPPWVSLSGRFAEGAYSGAAIGYLTERYGGNPTLANLFEHFIAMSLELLAPGGCLGYLVPDRLAVNAQFLRLRQRLLSETRLDWLTFGAPFPGVTVDTLILVLHRPRRGEAETLVAIGRHGRAHLHVRQDELSAEGGIHCCESIDILGLLDHVERQPRVLPLGAVCQTTSGFGGRAEAIGERRLEPEQVAVLKGESIGRFETRQGFWFDFSPENLTGRTTDLRKLRVQPRLLLRKTGDRLIATCDDSDALPEQSLYLLYQFQNGLSPHYLLGLLNSRLLTFFYRHRLVTNRHSLAHLKKVQLDAIPIRLPNLGAPDERRLHQELVDLVRQALALDDSAPPAERPARQAALDAEIDRRVYRLYALDPAQVRQVQECTADF